MEEKQAGKGASPQGPQPLSPHSGHLPSTHPWCLVLWLTGSPPHLESTGRRVPSATPSASPSFSSAALTSPLRCRCRKRSSLRGRQRVTSSPPPSGHPAEEPFCSWARAFCAAAGASGRVCIRSSRGRSRRNTCGGDVLGVSAGRPCCRRPRGGTCGAGAWS